MPVQKGKTSKQRHRQAARRSQLRENAAVRRAAKKQGKLKHAGKSSRDGRKARVGSGRTAEELVAEVNQGTVAASADAITDPRALVDLLKVSMSAAAPRPAATPAAAGPASASGNRPTDKVDSTRKWILSDEKIAQLPKHQGIEKLNNAIDEAERASKNTDVQRNANHYSRRGPAMAFWRRLEVHPLLERALADMRFTHPTPIQQASLPSTLCMSRNDRNPSMNSADAFKDFVISAETGSGKTLTFALPILQRIVTQRVAANPELLNEPAATGEAVAAKAVPSTSSAQTRVVGGKATRGGAGGTSSAGNSRRGHVAERRGAAAAAADEANDHEEEEEEDEDVDEEALEAADEEDEEMNGEEEEGAEEGEEDDEEGAEFDEEVDEEDYDEDDDEAMEDDHEGMDPLSDEAVGAIKALHSLILTPTRELAMQIHDCFKTLTTHCKHFVKVACIVGGMAPAKQQRILNRCPDVLICTPGRLWDLVQKNEGAFLGHSISRRLSCLVLDEADRLIESGKFTELQSILERIRCDVLPRGREEAVQMEELTEGVWDEVAQKFVPVHRVRTHKKDEPRIIPPPPPPADDHRTSIFVTSATMSLQVNFQNKNVRDKKILRTKNASTMKLVMNDLGLKDKTSAVFDLAPDANVVAKLLESYLRCPQGSKELYLYYFIRQYSRQGRIIVFVNAISMLRRLVKIFETLRIPIAGLHASMQQRQRMKVIDKFRAGVTSVLVATDVAARGLDVEGVRYVVHFQLPRSTDAYVHRCGRTARCGAEGFSCMFIHPDELHPMKQLLQSMGRSEKTIEIFSLDQTIVHRLRPQLMLAYEVDKMARNVRKTNANQGWVSRMAKDADLDAGDMVDDELGADLREKAKAAKILQRRLDAALRVESTSSRGSYLSAPRALGAADAVSKMHERAARQVRLTKTPGSGRR